LTRSRSHQKKRMVPHDSEVGIVRRTERLGKIGVLSARNGPARPSAAGRSRSLDSESLPSRRPFLGPTRMAESPRDISVLCVSVYKCTLGYIWPDGSIRPAFHIDNAQQNVSAQLEPGHSSNCVQHEKGRQKVSFRFSMDIGMENIVSIITKLL
jgi:hypothetical protein